VKAQNLTELIAWKPPIKRYIIDHDVLVPQTKLIIFGKPETWKSMLVMHTAFCIATGRDWFGYKTTKSFPIYILQIEIPKHKYRERVIKYTNGNEIYNDDIWFNSEFYIKLDRGYGVDYLDKELSELQPQILIVDPVFKVVSGRLTDESDVRQFQDKMDMLIDKYKLSLILVHHDRKDILVEGKPYHTPEDIFGSMFLNWCDTAIRTSNTNSNEVTLSFEKVRHAEEELKPMVIGIDRSKLKFRRKP
jgi:hypothetical protein